MNDINTPKTVAARSDVSPDAAASSSTPPPDLAGLVHQFRQALHRGTTDSLSTCDSPCDGIVPVQARPGLIGSVPLSEGASPPVLEIDPAPTDETNGRIDLRHGGAGFGAGRPEITDERDAPPEAPGAVMLESFFNQRASVTAASIQPQQPRPASLESVVAETVSRVLVSDPLHDGRREIRIDLSADVLPQTSIRLWRDEGRLHVEFNAPAFVANEGLRDALPRLGDAIQQRLPENSPIISLRTTEADAGQAGGDGRSRQQYQAFADDTPEEA